VAIKKSPISPTVPPEPMMTSNYRELLLLQEANHPNIVKVLGSAIGRGKKPQKQNESPIYVYLIMEYCENDLYGIIYNTRKGFLSNAALKGIMVQLLSALHYLRENSLMHRDIKPSNIFLGNDGYLRLGDFGLGRKLVK